MTAYSQRILVNAITFSRVPFVVMFMIIAILQSYTGHEYLVWVAGTALAIAAFTDLFDGRLARRWHVVSTFGAMADPLMDKVFYLVVFPTILWILGTQAHNSTHALVMLVFTVLYILRDQWVTFLRSIGAIYHADCSATWIGKFRTATSFPAAGIIYMYVTLHMKYLSGTPATIALGVVYTIEAALIILNLWTIVTYTLAYMPYLRRAIGRRDDER